MFDTLIEKAWIVASSDRVLKDAYLGIKDGKIAYIGEEKPAEDAKEKISGARKAVMPGLVNTHTHAAMSLLRGYADDYPLQEWLFQHCIPVEERFDPRCIYLGSLLAFAEMIRTGTVAISDMYSYIPQEAQAALEAGIYANISNGAFCMEREKYDLSTDKSFVQNEEMLKYYHNADGGRIRLDASVHAEYSTFDTVWDDFAAYAKEHDLNMQVHLSETEKEHLECIRKYGKTPTQLFAEHGVFDTRSTAGHCVWLSGEDVSILREKDVTAAHIPIGNLKLASGIAPAARYDAEGLRVSLGTDGVCSNNSYDLFEELKLSALLQKEITRDARAFNACKVFSLATENGAYAQRREKEIGRLDVGFDASLIMLDLDRPELYPVHNVLSTIVYSACGRDVCMTMVKGKIICKDGELYTIDFERLKHEIESYVMPRVFGK